MEFYFQSDSVKNSLICPKTKSATHCLTELFPFYQNKHWIIRRRDNHTIVLSSDRPTVLYWRLSDFRSQIVKVPCRHMEKLSEDWKREWEKWLFPSPSSKHLQNHSNHSNPGKTKLKDFFGNAGKAVCKQEMQLLGPPNPLFKVIFWAILLLKLC